MSNNIFSGKRFSLLVKQHLIHNNRFLLLSTVAYFGVVFIVLSIAQIGSELKPLDLEMFRGFLIATVSVFGILYVGYSFPAFRSKESTINYLMVPASLLEKFVFEFISRIGLILLFLPVFYWVIFNLHGYFFTMFSTQNFEAIGIQYLTEIELRDAEKVFKVKTLVALSSLFALVLAFTGAAMFTKQPLVKSLFSVAIIIILFVAYFYLVLEVMGVGQYNPPKELYLAPDTDAGAFYFVAAIITLANAIMLFVAYRKLKEREV